MKLRFLVLTLLLPSVALSQRSPVKQTEVKVQKTRLTTEQEIQLGKEAAAEVERQMEVVQDREVEAWLNEIGQRLAKTPQANSYPYYFKLVNEDSINAFALPGGPMFVHTGLIKAADDEGEVAGVLAHEMSHIALRHGAAQMSKQQLYGTLFGAIGAVGGAALGGAGGQCGLWCQAVQLGAGLGGNSVLMRFSRSFERDADLNGARMMASAGYNPIAVARFFEKLQAKSGTEKEPRGLQLWLSSHPAPGRRVEYVSQDIQFYARREYTSSTGRFPRIRQIVAGLPTPKPKPAAMLQPSEARPRSGLPQGFKDLQARGFMIAYPGNWQAGQAQGSGAVFVVPQGGARQNSNGGVELLFGGMVDYYVPQNRSANLEGATTEFLQGLQKGDSNLRAERGSAVTLGGKRAVLTRLRTRTSDSQNPEQFVLLYTVLTEAGLWNLALAAPASAASQAESVFQQMVKTVQFPD
jgi:Zn-dependent protease with chaperone function